MIRKTIYYIGLANGRCGLTTDTKAQTMRRIGSDNLSEFRPATQKDIDWIRGMGGQVPQGRVLGSTK